jgi:6-phosphogluconolactonase
MIDVRVEQDPIAVVCEMLVDAACSGGHLALSGGSTPRAAYELAAARGEDFSAATLWLGDERVVPPDAPESNEGMVRAALVDRMPEDHRPRLMRVPTELGTHAAADAYEQRLREEVGNHPRLDLALMGLGGDAHTASLFPGDAALGEAHRLAVGVDRPGMEPYVPRVTLTLPVFNAARDVVFLVTGEGKADAVARAFGEPPDESAPSAHVRPGAGNLILVLDAAAAARLGTR